MIQDIYKESFTDKGLKSPFNDFLILKDFQNEVISLEEEGKIKRVHAGFKRILNLILWLHEVEKNEQEENMYIIRAVHESLCMNFRSVINTSLWFLHKYAKTEISTPLEFFLHEHELTPEKQYYLSLKWFDALDLILSGIEGNSLSLKVFGGNKTEIRFQLYDDDLTPVLRTSPELMNTEALISSVNYFSVNFFGMIKYFELLMKYTCMKYFSIKNYNQKITEVKSQHPNEDTIISLDNCEEMMQIYEIILNQVVN